MGKKSKKPKKPQRVWRRLAPAPTQIHELTITLRDSKPLIWRRVAVPSDMTLGGLHDVIQIFMGWTHSHLHQFVVPRASPPKELRALGFARHMRNDRFFSDPRFELEDTENEYGVTVNDVAPAVKSKFEYQYDFGDSWDHTIQVMKIYPPVEGVRYPGCLAGKLACPPDDCGGSTATTVCLKPSKTPTTKTTNTSRNGLVMTLTPSTSIWKRSTKTWPASVDPPLLT